MLVGDPKLGGISSTICAYEALKVEQWGVQSSEYLGAVNVSLLVELTNGKTCFFWNLNRHLNAFVWSAKMQLTNQCVYTVFLNQ